MGEILMPPYLWFNIEESTPGLNGLVGEDNNPSTSRTERQRSTPDLRQRGLVGEHNKTGKTTSNQANKQKLSIQYNQDHIHSSSPDLRSRGLVGEYIHSDLNILLQANTSQDQRSVLINDDNIDNRRVIITNDSNEKKNVFERLSNSTSEQRKS